MSAASGPRPELTSHIDDLGKYDTIFVGYLPENYDGTRKFPMMVTMPGYDRMWFGEASSRSNVERNGFRAWTELDEEMIVISAQLTDRHEKSARQANELAQYFIDNFAVDTDRIYAAGYSARKPRFRDDTDRSERRHSPYRRLAGAICA